MKKKPGKKAKSKLTPRDKKFAEVFAKTGDPRWAAAAAYPDPSFLPQQYDALSKKQLATPEIVEECIKVWDALGLTLTAAAKVHLEVLTGRGKWVKAGDKLKAVEMIYKGRGVKNFVKEEVADDQQSNDPIAAFIKNRELRGLAVPPVILDAVVVEKNDPR